MLDNLSSVIEAATASSHQSPEVSGSPGRVRPSALDGHPQQDASFTLHSCAVFVPVRMLARDLAVVRDQAVHGLGEWHHLDGTLHLDPVAVEGVGEREEGGPGPWTA